MMLPFKKKWAAATDECAGRSRRVPTATSSEKGRRRHDGEHCKRHTYSVPAKLNGPAAAAPGHLDLLQQEQFVVAKSKERARGHGRKPKALPCNNNNNNNNNNDDGRQGTDGRSLGSSRGTEWPWLWL